MAAATVPHTEFDRLHEFLDDLAAHNGNMKAALEEKKKNPRTRYSDNVLRTRFNFANTVDEAFAADLKHLFHMHPDTQQALQLNPAANVTFAALGRMFSKDRNSSTFRLDFAYKTEMERRCALYRLAKFKQSDPRPPEASVAIVASCMQRLCRVMGDDVLNVLEFANTPKGTQ